MASTLKCDTIQNASSALANLALNTDGTVSTRGITVTGPSSNSIYALGSLSGTITMNFSNSTNQSVTLAGNSTLANPSNLVAGMSGTLFVTQDATGSRTLAYGTYWDFPNQAAPSLTTTANAVDLLVITYRSSTGYWYAALAKDFK